MVVVLEEDIIEEEVKIEESESDEIRATLVDHVINRGFTMEEAGRRVQPNVNRSTVSSIVLTFRRENR